MLVDAVLRDLHQGWRVRVDRDGRRALDVCHGVDVPGWSLAGYALAHLDVGRAVGESHLLFHNRAVNTDEANPRNCVVVIARALARHPHDQPGINPIIFIQKAIAAALSIGHHQGAPEIFARGNIGRKLYELGGCERPIAGRHERAHCREQFGGRRNNLRPILRGAGICGSHLPPLS